MTIKEIANLAGVSISTVSKIVNNKDDNINSDTRDRVLKIVKEYNYTPYGAAKNLSNAKSFLLGVLLSDVNGASNMLNGILAAAQKHGYGILIFDSKGSVDEELKHITSLCRHRVDGLLWEPAGAKSEQHVSHLRSAQIRIRYIQSPFSSDSMNIDYQELGYLCASRLLNLGHNKIACALKQDCVCSSAVLEGVKKCLFDFGLPFDSKMEFWDKSFDNSGSVYSGGYTGIICSHYALALDLYRDCKRLHYQLPANLSLISMISGSLHSLEHMPVSAFEIPDSDLGFQACESLIQCCEKTEEAASAPIIFHPVFTLNHEKTLAIPPSSKNKQILVVGSIHMDNTFAVDELPQAGNITPITNAVSSLGGKGANQAVQAARLGRETTLIGKIGNDSESNFVFNTLAHEHVSADGVCRDEKLSTGKAYIYVPKDGEGAITILPGANSRLFPQEIIRLESLFSNASYCLLSTEIPINTITQAAKIAKEHSVCTLLKPAALNELPKELCCCTDIFVPNQKEAETLSHISGDEEKQAAYFFSLGIPIIIITLGRRGCYLKTSETSRYFPAPCFPAVDTTGGADAFLSALSVYLSEGYSLEASIQIAQYAAGFCISRQGVISAMADKNSLSAHISRFEPELLEFSYEINTLQ